MGSLWPQPWQITNLRILTYLLLFLLFWSVIPFLCHILYVLFLYFISKVVMYYKYWFLQSKITNRRTSFVVVTITFVEVIPHPGLIVYFVSLLMVGSRVCSLLTTLLNIVWLSIALVAAFIMMVRVSVTILLVPVSCISSCKLASVCCMWNGTYVS